MYLTYAEYQQWGGTLTEQEFNRFSYRAEKEIDNNTQNRLKSVKDIPDDVKHCMFELVEFISNNTLNGAVMGVTSVSNDGYSESYSGAENAQGEMYNIIYTYLSGTGLMYCGVCDLET